MTDFSLLDLAAVLWFLLSWIGFAYFADQSRYSKDSMYHTMNVYRRRWMEEMLKRDNRVVDTQIIGNQLNGAAFFASTMILLVGGLFALLGATDKAIGVFEALPFIEPPTLLAWEIKILLMMIIFIYGFFKFAWAFRIYKFCSVLIGAAPGDRHDDKEAGLAAQRAAEINNLGARHFNNGLRSLFFGQAALAWFLHPLLFIAASMLVVLVLHRREFRSRSLKAVRAGM